MTKKNGTPSVFKVTRLYGRCLTIQVGPASFEVKVMGERPIAAAHREALIGALVDAGAEEVKTVPAGITLVTKGDD
jgi:hypothetical protein